MIMFRCRLALVLASMCWTWGCQLTPTFTTGYELSSGSGDEPLVADDLLVLPLEDDRPARLYSTSGKIMLTLIPFVPYVSLPYERIEESVQIISDDISNAGSGITLYAEQRVAPPISETSYVQSFSRAIAADIKNDRLFRNVRVGDSQSSSERFVLSGTLIRTPLRNSVTSYGLGFVGVILWFLPIPVGRQSAEVELRLALTDTHSNEVIWHDTVQANVSRMYMLYTSSAMIYGRKGAFSFNLIPPPGESRVDKRSLYSWHFEALRRGMVSARQSLRKSLSQLQSYGVGDEQRP
ncbi:MAG: hypothetical protein DWP92_09910 [Armatimonadetes bacterium]|nr:MAG: hypothetical protein DWP92_09910 [Armatimonadota bacterium]